MMHIFFLQFFACFAKLQSNMDLDESTKYRCLKLYLNLFPFSDFWRRIHGGATFLMPMCSVCFERTHRFYATFFSGHI